MVRLSRSCRGSWIGSERLLLLLLTSFGSTRSAVFIRWLMDGTKGKEEQMIQQGSLNPILR
jgi:hypothetical protein